MAWRKESGEGKGEEGGPTVVQPVMNSQQSLPLSPGFCCHHLGKQEASPFLLHFKNEGPPDRPSPPPTILAFVCHSSFLASSTLNFPSRSWRFDCQDFHLTSQLCLFSASSFVNLFLRDLCSRCQTLLECQRL